MGRKIKPPRIERIERIERTFNPITYHQYKKKLAAKENCVEITGPRNQKRWSANAFCHAVLAEFMGLKSVRGIKEYQGVALIIQ